MSRSRNTAKRRFGYWNGEEWIEGERPVKNRAPGYEYWSKRPMSGLCNTKHKGAKKMTHRRERCRYREQIKEDWDHGC